MLQYHLNHIYMDAPRRFGDFELIQLGRIIGRPQKTIAEPHKQYDWYELTLVTAGSGCVYTDGTPTDVRPGDVYLSLPGEIHAIETTREDPISYDFLTFRAKDTILTDGLCAMAEHVRDPHSRVIRDASLFSLVGSALQELEKEDAYTAHMMPSLLAEVSVHLIRDYRGQRGEPEKPRSAQNLCYSLMNYIDTNVRRMKDLSELSAVSDYNYAYLSDLFHRTTGKTLRAYFREKKLAESVKMITEEGMSPTRAAEELGYSSPFAFTRAFRSQYGIPPSEYKKH